jgi:membrane fusion protein, multidrug efflux system
MNRTFVLSLHGPLLASLFWTTACIAEPSRRSTVLPLEAASPLVWPAAFGTSSEARQAAVLISAGEETTLSSRMAGKIKTLNLAIGQRFLAGEVLAELDCQEQEARLQSARAEFLGARETHLAKVKLQGLGAAGELEVTMAAAAADKAQSAVRQQEVQNSFCKVVAPYTGQVARLRAKPFESIAMGQPILEIVAEGRQKAVMHVPSAWLSWLSEGAPVRIAIGDTGREHEARVSKLNSRVDGVSQTLEIEAELIDARDSRLLPGMIGIAYFPQRRR